MVIDTLTYPAALSLAFALMFLVTFSTLLGVRRRLHEQDGNLKRLAELVAEREAVAPAGDGGGLARLEGELDNMNSRLGELVRAQRDQYKISGVRSLTDATRSAREGIAPEDIAAHCGISTGEAELLVRLHGPRSGH